MFFRRKEAMPVERIMRELDNQIIQNKKRYVSTQFVIAEYKVNDHLSETAIAKIDDHIAKTGNLALFIRGKDESFIKSIKVIT